MFPRELIADIANVVYDYIELDGIRTQKIYTFSRYVFKDTKLEDHVITISKESESFRFTAKYRYQKTDNPTFTSVNRSIEECLNMIVKVINDPVWCRYRDGTIYNCEKITRKNMGYNDFFKNRNFERY